MKDRACLQDIIILYSRRIGEQLSMHLGQKVTGVGETRNTRSSYMAIIILDEKNDQFVRLKLSSFRKIVKVVSKAGWLEFRRLTIIERFKLKCREGKVCDRLREKGIL